MEQRSPFQALNECEYDLSEDFPAFDYEIFSNINKEQIMNFDELQNTTKSFRDGIHEGEKLIDKEKDLSATSPDSSYVIQGNTMRDVGRPK